MDDEDIAVSSAHDFAANWKPIETAPKDGAILGCGRDGVAIVKRFAWPTVDGSSVWYLVHSETDDMVPWDVTHWMPLPDPPDDKNA